MPTYQSLFEVDGRHIKNVHIGSSSFKLGTLKV